MKDSAAALLNKDWKFLLGEAKGAYKKKYNDRSWKRIDLPHDWVIGQPFSRYPDGKKDDGWTAQNMQGFFTWDKVCWYRKEFSLPDVSAKKVYIYFGGAYRNSTVYVNGQEAGGRAYGYSSFELDVSGFVKKGKNKIAVRLDNGCEMPDRWYSGSGLYRNVYLKILPLTHIKNWGILIKTEKNNVKISTTVVSADKKAKGKINISILSPDSQKTAEESLLFDMDGNGEITVIKTLSVKNPSMWSAENPFLYRALINIDGEEGQTVEERFGFHEINIAYNKGMTVNGQNVKLKGVCLHHDAGITGSAYYDDVWRRRLNILKSIGCNAIRTSHNPPAGEFLDLCDEMGFYVIDECFDKWKSGYYAAHFDTDAERDLRDMILRDRNHPCIFIWSIGNEVENQGQESMLSIQKKLAQIVRSLDGRPVTCALEPHVHPRNLVGAPISELVYLTKKIAKDTDVLGLNYHEPLYQAYTEKIEKPILGTECYEYYCGTAENYEDVTTKNPWQFVLENENVIGQYIWAGIDYFGESVWPAKGWTGAILDICGFMKPNAFFRKSIWSSEKMVYLAIYDQSIKRDYARGRWSFPAMVSHLNNPHLEGRMVKAAVFTNCGEARLIINGKKMGVRRPGDFNNGIIEWDFEYQEGEIEVRGFEGGKEVCSYKLRTAGQAQKIKLNADKNELAPGGIAHIEVDICDKEGLLCANEEVLVEFSLTGDGGILGACPPDITQSLGYTLPKVVTSGGKALVMIKAGDSYGNLELCAYSAELGRSSIKFKMKKQERKNEKRI